MTGLDFQGVAQAALSQAHVLLADWLPGGKVEGKEYVATNPTRGDRKPGSFKVNTDTGVWCDFATHDGKGRDLVSLFAYLNNLEQGAALFRVAERIAVDPGRNGGGKPSVHQGSREAPTWKPIVPIPNDAGKSEPHPRLGKPSQTWCYRDASGNRLGWVCRFDQPDGSKEVLPLVYAEGPDGQRGWRWQGFPTPRPLYGLDRLAARPDAPVLVVEGEKTADAAQARFPEWVAITSPSGSKAAAKADWSPLMGRPVVIWPDHDEPGLSYAQDVARLVMEAGAASVKVVQVPGDFPPWWDVADPLPEGWTPEGLRQLPEQAPVWEPPAQEQGQAPGQERDQPQGEERADHPDPVPFNSHQPSPLPVDVLPTWAAGFIAHAAEHHQVAPDMVLANVLGAVATACARKLRVEIRPGYQEPVNLYLLCPALPGERKSATQALAVGPLLDWEREQAQVMAGEIREAASRRKSEEAVINTLRSKLGKANPEDRPGLMQEITTLELALTEVPRAPRLLADDLTPEAAAALMAEQGERLGIISAEGGLFDTLAGRYSNGVANLDLFLKAHSGDSVRVDRRHAPPVVMQSPALTLCLSPQPEILAGLADKPGFRGRGLIARFVFVLPASRMGYRQVSPPPVPGHVLEGYRRAIISLLDLPWAVDEQGNQTAHVLKLSLEARRDWEDFSAAIESALKEGGELEAMRDWGGKLPGLAARLAGLIHAMEHLEAAPGKPVSQSTMERALNLAGALVGHALAAFQQMGADPDLEAAKHALAWIRRERIERFTTRDCHRALRGRYPRAAQVQAALAVLDERAFIFPQEAARPGPGRPASPGYTTNPKALEG